MYIHNVVNDDPLPILPIPHPHPHPHTHTNTTKSEEANPEKLNNQFKNKFFYFKVRTLHNIILMIYMCVHDLFTEQELKEDCEMSTPYMYTGWWQGPSAEKVLIYDRSHYNMGKSQTACVRVRLISND